MAVESELKRCVSVVLRLAFNHLFLCKGMVISDVRTRRPMCVWPRQRRCAREELAPTVAAARARRLPVSARRRRRRRRRRRLAARGQDLHIRGAPHFTRVTYWQARLPWKRAVCEK
ncbi:hypothetical protein AOLI_G00304900 [Acnodon oligacanthus]